MHSLGKARIATAVLFGVTVLAARTLAAVPIAPNPPTGDVTGTVSDSATGKPLPGGEVRLMQYGGVVATTVTDAFGRFVIHNLSAGTYALEIRYLGYRSASRTVTLAATGATASVDLRLAPIPINLEAVEVQAAVPLAVDTRTGNQIFKQNDYHGSPTNTTSQILQQSIAGAARAPTGEVHIRGQHAEYTYYVDGVPVPAGISGSLNELFDPEVVNQIDFQTGGWDAEYGNKNAAVVNVNTRIPAGRFHLDASNYNGSFASQGQALNVSTNAGKFGFFASGARQATDMRREPVVFDTVNNVAQNFHNDGTDLFGFAKAQYIPGSRDVVNLDVSRSRTRFAVPFDSVEGIIDDHQQDVNGFVNLGWHHRFGEAAAVETGASELFAGAFFRDGSLTYTPGPTDDPSFIFYPDTTPYNLSEDRNFHTIGVKADYLIRLHHGLEFKLGTLSSVTRGHEDFETTDSAGNPGPASVSDLKGAMWVSTARLPSRRRTSSSSAPGCVSTTTMRRLPGTSIR